ncbi:MAG: hypothetical protein IPI58_08105 [Alphaproteobacteria bacterium]|nr:MAG: hypothetical protein IPI58_08105 [Alphaproteobacteria bacterium]
MAILAVLTAAISAASGEFNGDISAVKAKAQATAILGYAHEVKLGVERVLGKGCTDAQISFENRFSDGMTDGLHRDINSNAPSDKSCHVFDINGGGIVWKEPPKGANIISGAGAVWWVSDFVPYIIGGYAAIPNLGTSDNELVLYLPISDEKLCVQINKLIGVSMYDTQGMYGSDYTVDYFRGIYSPFSYAGYTPGVMSSCVHYIGPWFPSPLGISYYFYYVLKVN